MCPIANLSFNGKHQAFNILRENRALNSMHYYYLSPLLWAGILSPCCLNPKRETYTTFTKVSHLSLTKISLHPYMPTNSVPDIMHKYPHVHKMCINYRELHFLLLQVRELYMLSTDEEHFRHVHMCAINKPQIHSTG